MNRDLQNQLHMIGACLNVAQSPDYKSVWNGKAPADFTTDVAQLAAAHAAITGKAAQAEAATGGAADAKAAAETALEDAAFVLARALAFHYKKTGDLDRRGKVDLTKSEIVKLRTQDLIDQATAIRNLAAAAVSEVGAAGRGVTEARIAALSTDIATFAAVMNTPRGQIVNRSVLLREVETDVAELLDLVRDLDDLVVQFDGDEAGQRFVEAWKQARFIVNTASGQGNGNDIAPAPSTPPAAPPAGLNPAR